MTLTRRLTLFFFAALAVVLVAFSVALYLLADHHLTRQLDERLEAAARTLASVAELESDGVDWEPEAHPLALSPGSFGDQLHWAITTDDGHVIDQSQQPGVGELLREADAGFRSGHRNPRRFDHAGRAWQVTRIRLVSESPPEKIQAGKHSVLVLTVAVPLEPVQTTLRTLAVTLAGLTLAILAVALVLGRAVCRRALAPVARMADAARGMGAADLSEPRFPLPQPPMNWPIWGVRSTVCSLASPKHSSANGDSRAKHRINFAHR